mgnify:CR=1 FL=1
MKLFKPKFWDKNNIIVFILWPLTLITRLVILIKNYKTSHKTNIKSICVGNIYLGGTGKTQLVIKLNEILKKKYKIFIIKKYYKNQIDEQKLLSKRANLILPKNRIFSLNKIKNSKKNLAIFDDGLQDKSLSYNLSIVCFSSITGVGNGKLLPAGPLRESLSKLSDYSAVFINGKKNKYLENKIKKYNKNIKIFSGEYFLKNKNDFDLKSKYLVFCGIGTPESFFKLLKENKIKIEKKIVYPDHYNYKFSDIDKIKKIAKENKLKILTTEKDFTKINKFNNFNVKFTNIDLYINNYKSFKRFIINNL